MACRLINIGDQHLYWTIATILAICDTFTVVVASQALAIGVPTPYAHSLAQPDSYTSGGGGRESGKVLYNKLSQRLVRGATNQIVSLVAYPIVNGEYTRMRNGISSVYSRIRHRKLCNAIKMQSDWSRLIRGAGTTQCIALYQTLSLSPFSPRESLAARD